MRWPIYLMSTCPSVHPSSQHQHGGAEASSGPRSVDEKVLYFLGEAGSKRRKEGGTKQHLLKFCPACPMERSRIFSIKRISV